MIFGKLYDIMLLKFIRGDIMTRKEDAVSARLEKIRDGQRHDVALRALFKTLLRMEREAALAKRIGAAG